MEHVDELIAAHALHALDPDDRRHVEAHLAQCERCRQQLAEYESVAATLAYTAPAAEPPPELRTRVLAAIEPVVPAVAPAAEAEHGTQRRSWWPRLAVFAAPVLAAALVGMLVWNVALQNDLDNTRSSLDATRSELAAGTVVNLPDVGNAVTDTSGRVTLYASLPDAPSGSTYQAWVIAEGTPLPAGIFDGGGTVELELTRQVRPGDSIAVTIEPSGGSEQPTTEPLALGEV